MIHSRIGEKQLWSQIGAESQLSGISECVARTTNLSEQYSIIADITKFETPTEFKNCYIQFSSSYTCMHLLNKLWSLSCSVGTMGPISKLISHRPLPDERIVDLLEGLSMGFAGISELFVGLNHGLGWASCPVLVITRQLRAHWQPEIMCKKGIFR